MAVDPVFFILGLSASGSVNIVPGLENGMSGEDFFLSGEEVVPTAFLSSGYDPAHHTPAGMIGTGETIYAPQLAPAVVALLQAPCTVVFDATHVNDGSGASKCYILCDAAEYLEVEIGRALSYNDNTASISATELGVASPTPPGRYKMAFTRINESVSASVSGGAVFTTEADPLNPLGTVVLGVSWAGSVIHELTIYTTPVADGGLPALSAL